jgi:hypothetical protein
VLGIAIVVLVLGGLGESARFEHVFALLVVSGLLTALGGMLLSSRPAARAA